jgi:hypothetical protein
MDSLILNFDSKKQVFEFNEEIISGLDFKRLAMEPGLRPMSLIL